MTLLLRQRASFASRSFCFSQRCLPIPTSYQRTLTGPTFSTLSRLGAEELDTMPQYQLKTPKGTKDWEGRDMVIRDKIFSTITQVFKRHGAVTIDTSVIVRVGLLMLYLLTLIDLGPSLNSKKSSQVNTARTVNLSTTWQTKAGSSAHSATT